MLDYELNEFGRRLGLSGIDLSGGPLSMGIEGIGTLTLEVRDAPEGRELLVMLSAPFPESDTERLRALLAASDWRSNPPYTVSTGALRDKAFALVRIPEDEVKAAAVENALRYLASFLGERR